LLFADEFIEYEHLDKITVIDELVKALREKNDT